MFKGYVLSLKHKLQGPQRGQKKTKMGNIASYKDGNTQWDLASLTTNGGKAAISEMTSFFLL